MIKAKKAKYLITKNSNRGEESTLAQVLDGYTNGELIKNKEIYIVDARESNRFIIARGGKDTFRNEDYIKTIYTVHNPDGKVKEFNDGRFENRPKNYWNKTKTAISRKIVQTTPASVGGSLYWSYYGFRSRVEWFACFVHWCMRNTASTTGSYPQTSNNAYCQTVADNFRDLGQFKNSSEYGNLTKGDVIFFDWQSDGHTDHIGLVIGRDNNYVYTVEGNSGDAVKIKKYSLSSSVIYGYAFMNY